MDFWEGQDKWTSWVREDLLLSLTLMLRTGEEELVEVSVILEDLTVVKVCLVDLSFPSFTDIWWNCLFHFMKLKLLGARTQHQLFHRPSTLI